VTGHNYVLTDTRVRLTRGSAVAEGPRDAPCRLKACRALHTWMNNRISSGERRSFLVIGNDAIDLFNTPYIITSCKVVCSNSVSVLHYFRDIFNFTLFVTRTGVSISRPNWNSPHGGLSSSTMSLALLLFRLSRLHEKWQLQLTRRMRPKHLLVRDATVTCGQCVTCNVVFTE